MLPVSICRPSRVPQMRLPRPFAAAAFAAAVLCVPVSADPPAWADPKLPVRDGLELWLDATRAWGDQRAPGDGKLKQWLDASGHGRHLNQSAKDAQPARLPAGTAAAVRFDGTDDHLRATKLGAELNAFTVIVAAVPRANPGPFRGLFAANAANGRDYETGLNIDLGFAATPRFSAVNVEGKGFGGVQNLRTADGPFGKFQVLQVSSDGSSVRLAVDGKAEGQRPRTGGPLSLDEITMGSRFYENGTGPQKPTGFVRADVAEVLVYARVLSADESVKVRAYLAGKYAGLVEALPAASGGSDPLVVVADPPSVQVFPPGFTARELPVDLTNINNVKYRPDGTLVALGYDGRVWLLRDSDGDGAEDKADLFWDPKGQLQAPIGMDLTPPGYKHGDGVFVAAKGRIALIVDTDKYGKADREIVVAGGWKEIANKVDALGVAYDPRDGSIYYGRGAFSYTEPLRKTKDGKAEYSTADEPGTILRVSPDFKTREIVATGIRFPVALRFNRLGDLFCTDQEGATWVPNGNPLDELLHVQKGRHYGFPARHPVHLPNVLDEPSTFDYGPQHQSTCGLNFNESVRDGGPTFGPKEWAGDALVAGETRGKLYRTKLVKSAAGYVARTHLLASLPMLAIDLCVSPDGGLVVCCHGGGPDWGSGPTGKGKLFKISYADRDHPQPVFAWPAGPREVRIEFDRPVDPGLLKDVARKTKITGGEFVRAGDRFETMWPGYAIVQAQKLAPRDDYPVRSAQLTADRRTLVLATDPHPAAVHYAATLPGMGRPAEPSDKQHPAIDLDFDLSGCEATWTPADGSAPWVGWLPHPDLQAARELTAGSAPHDALWAAMAKPGELRLKMQLDLTDMLRPAVQPGSRIDQGYPPEVVTVAFDSPAKLVVSGASGSSLTVTPEKGKPIPVELRLTTSGSPAVLAVRWTTNEDSRPRPLPLHRVLVPWADANPATRNQVVVAVSPPELEGGSWARGREVFFGEAAGCAKCHTHDGRGGVIGPDLSNLVHRDYPSVLRDITQPSFAINPDHLTSVVSLADGRTLTGVVRTVGDRLAVGDLQGKVTEVGRAEVDSVKPSPLSTMPEGLPQQLGPDRTRDLMTFLLTAGPAMPRDYKKPEERPKPRTAAEVNAVLAGAPKPPEKTRKLRVVLVAGKKDHGLGEHDYPAWQKAWAELFGAAKDVEVATAWEWPEKQEFQKADAMVFYQHGDWDAKRAADIDAFLERGGGLVYVHWAVDGRLNVADFAKRIGLASKGGNIKYRHGPLDLAFAKVAHPITRNFDRLALVDESYWMLTGDLPGDRVLATQVEDKEPRPLFWTTEPGKGRVFVSIPGHYSWTFDDPLFRVLLLRGLAWTAREPVDRFNELVWPGADVAK